MKIQCNPNVTVTLRVDDVDLPEYQERTVHGRACTESEVYVRSILGQNFTVHVAADDRIAHDSNSPSDKIASDIYVDGTVVTRHVHKPPFKVNIKGFHDTQEDLDVFRCFRFAELTTTDDSGDFEDDISKAKLKSLGTIEVKCYWVREDGPPKQRRRARNVTGIGFNAVRTVPEKALKGRAISYCIGPLSSRKPSRTYPYGKTPIALFKLNYRSLDDLQKELIIPRSQSAAASPLEERDPDTLTLEEARDVVRHMQQRGHRGS
ncbi:hypothetical protein MRB53_038319 [Persea americana]|nr:hypothetical protein MRB53_038319 [Persea americana]